MRFILSVLVLIVAVVSARSLTAQKQKSLAALQTKAWLARFAQSRHYGKNFAIATSLASQGFEGFEHYIGTTGTLTQSGAISMDLSIPGEPKTDFNVWSKKTTDSRVLVSKDKVDWSYAEMTAIAGDYFGPKNSVESIICWDEDMGGAKKDGAKGMETRFKKAFDDIWENPEYGHNTTNGNTRLNWKDYMTKEKVGLISQARTLLEKEKAGYLKTISDLKQAGKPVDKVGSAYYDNAPSSVAGMLAGLANHNGNMFASPNLENIGFAESLAYNDDHWSTCADRTIAYGHKLAVDTAFKAGERAFRIKKGNNGKLAEADIKDLRKQLIEAFAYSGFTSHFVSDRFSAGHIRTPFTALRHIGQQLGVTATSTGLTGNVQHDEENKNCLLVKNKLGHLWWACGDHRFFDDDNAQNRRQIRDTMEAIIKSIRSAFLDGMKGDDKKLNTYYTVPFDWLPTTELDTRRQKLENICPMFILKTQGNKKKLFVRKIECILTGVPRPPAAAALNIKNSGKSHKFGGSIASTSSSELFPARKTVQITYLPTLPKKGNWECEYVEATKNDFCTPLGRATPALSKDQFTYINACKGAQKFGGKTYC